MDWAGRCSSRGPHGRRRRFCGIHLAALLIPSPRRKSSFQGTILKPAGRFGPEVCSAWMSPSSGLVSDPVTPQVIRMVGAVLAILIALLFPDDQRREERRVNRHRQSDQPPVVLIEPRQQ